MSSMKTLRMCRVPLILYFWYRYYYKEEKESTLKQFLYLYLPADLAAIILLKQASPDIVIHHLMSIYATYQTIENKQLTRARDYVLMTEITVVLNGLYTMAPHKIWNVLNMLAILPGRFWIWRQLDKVFKDDLDEDSPVRKIGRMMINIIHAIDMLWLKQYYGLVAKKTIIA